MLVTLHPITENFLYPIKVGSVASVKKTSRFSQKKIKVKSQSVDIQHQFVFEINAI